MRYVEESGAASPNWQTPTDMTINGDTIKEATFGGLTEKKLYRVEVRAVVVDPSAWSASAFVYPHRWSSHHEGQGCDN